MKQYERYEKFEYKEYPSSNPEIFFLDKETGDIYRFFKSYSSIPVKFKTEIVGSLKKGE